MALRERRIELDVQYFPVRVIRDELRRDLELAALANGSNSRIGNRTIGRAAPRLENPGLSAERPVLVQTDIENGSRDLAARSRNRSAVASLDLRDQETDERIAQARGELRRRSRRGAERGSLLDLRPGRPGGLVLFLAVEELLQVAHVELLGDLGFLARLGLGFFLGLRFGKLLLGVRFRLG